MATLIFALIISSIAAGLDIRSRRIPNWLTCSATLFGVGYHTILNGGHGFLFGAEGLFLGLALLIVFYALGGMGAGDVKLLAAVGALLGPKGVFITFIFTALVGGIYAMVLLFFRFRLIGTAVRLSTMFSSLRCGVSFSTSNTDGEPPALNYGVCIAIGVFLTAFWNLYAG